VRETQCPCTAIRVGTLGGMTREVIGLFRQNKRIGSPSPVFTVNQQNTNQLIVRKLTG